MGRKNRAGHTNQRTRRGTSPGGGDFRRAGQYAPLNIEGIVLPASRCGRKATFTSKAEADRALQQAQESRGRQNSPYMEKRNYQCPKCDGWHLTSRESYVERDPK